MGLKPEKLKVLMYVNDVIKLLDDGWLNNLHPKTLFYTKNHVILHGITDQRSRSSMSRECTHVMTGPSLNCTVGTLESCTGCDVTIRSGYLSL